MKQRFMQGEIVILTWRDIDDMCTDENYLSYDMKKCKNFCVKIVKNTIFRGEGCNSGKRRYYVNRLTESEFNNAPLKMDITYYTYFQILDNVSGRLWHENLVHFPINTIEDYETFLMERIE